MDSLAEASAVPPGCGLKLGRIKHCSSLGAVAYAGKAREALGAGDHAAGMCGAQL